MTKIFFWVLSFYRRYLKLVEVSTEVVFTELSNLKANSSAVYD